MPEGADESLARPKMNLMDAIKGFSVTDLKKEEEQSQQRSKAAEKATADAPLSMADELKKRMERRLSFISGKNPDTPPPAAAPLAPSRAFAKITEESDDDDDFDDEPVRSARPPPPPLPPSALVQKPAPVARPPPPKLPQERRGSMFDPSNKDINKMLAPPPWLSKTEESDGEGDDWDADSD